MHFLNKLKKPLFLQISAVGILSVTLYIAIFFTQNPKTAERSEAYSCCTGPSYCSSFEYSSCSNDTSCIWSCGVPTPTVTPLPTPPLGLITITVTSPQEGYSAEGLVNITVTTTGDVKYVKFGLEENYDKPNVWELCTDFSAPFTCSFDSNLYPVRDYLVVAHAFNPDLGFNEEWEAFDYNIINIVDKTAPTAPYLTVKNTSDYMQYSFELTSTASKDNRDIPNYSIWRNGTKIHSFTPIMDQVTESYQYTDKSLSCGSYSYEVTAQDNSGNVSSSANVIRTAVCAPSNLKVTGITSKSVSLSWNSSTTPYISHYRIGRDDGGYGPDFTANQTSYTDTSVTSGKTYIYNVSAVNINGSESVLSNYVEVVVPASDQLPSVYPTSIRSNSGDANGDGKANGADYLIWFTNYQKPTTSGNIVGDFNRDGIVNGADYIVWFGNYSL